MYNNSIRGGPMRILIVSDKVSPKLYEYLNLDNFKDIDLILSAGDLKASYLSFLTTTFRVPLLYIHGNHDLNYHEDPPLGCIDIDGMVYEYQNIRILGIGGCLEYRGGPHQYTEKTMKKRIKKIKNLKKGFDLILSHSPAYQLGDGQDQAHTGFKVFVDLLEKYQPQYMIHGHQHLNYCRSERIINYQETTIINAYEYYILEL